MPAARLREGLLLALLRDAGHRDARGLDEEADVLIAVLARAVLPR